MEDAVFMAKLEEARKRIAGLPDDEQAPLRQLLEEAHRRHADLQENFARIHNAVADWKINIKYLMFDLEATKRELAALRREQQESDEDKPEN